MARRKKPAEKPVQVSDYAGVRSRFCYVDRDGQILDGWKRPLRDPDVIRAVQRNRRRYGSGSVK